jgi:hypothetical protein
MQTKSTLRYTILPSGGLSIEISAYCGSTWTHEEFNVPEYAIVTNTKNKQYGVWVGDFAHQYFSARNIGLYSVVRVDTDVN